MTDYRTKCLSHKPEQCLICGTEENIDVHHKDGDPQNNSLENLVPLCEKHHTGVHKGESPNTELNESANGPMGRPIGLTEPFGMTCLCRGLSGGGKSVI